MPKTKQAEGIFLVKGNSFTQRRDGDVGKVVLVFDWNTELADALNALCGKRVKVFFEEHAMQTELPEQED